MRKLKSSFKDVPNKGEKRVIKESVPVQKEIETPVKEERKSNLLTRVINKIFKR